VERPHRGSDQPLDISAKTRRPLRSELQLDAVLLAAALKRTRIKTCLAVAPTDL